MHEDADDALSVVHADAVAVELKAVSLTPHKHDSSCVRRHDGRALRRPVVHPAMVVVVRKMAVVVPLHAKDGGDGPFRGAPERPDPKLLRRDDGVEPCHSLPLRSAPLQMALPSGSQIDCVGKSLARSLTRIERALPIPSGVSIRIIHSPGGSSGVVGIVTRHTFPSLTVDVGNAVYERVPASVAASVPGTGPNDTFSPVRSRPSLPPCCANTSPSSLATAPNGPRDPGTCTSTASVSPCAGSLELIRMSGTDCLTSDQPGEGFPAALAALEEARLSAAAGEALARAEEPLEPPPRANPRQPSMQRRSASKTDAARA
eukprot:CAMPEP_0170143956 /NCGR_PEP_ID=MMETSP0033_2-20121228/13223_1 /TAXON_ID=195969 /ORGANISM="Dolichomastix tenuilepis, Strain CCMP3274" /LENGTH=316 /DNA_ID=CAMNT_0010380429 /DNA_START=287 /DNA_END=1239 /DNA_ORIENTATION=+